MEEAELCRLREYATFLETQMDEHQAIYLNPLSSEDSMRKANDIGLALAEANVELYRLFPELRRKTSGAKKRQLAQRLG